MKRCPTCHREYLDDYQFCLEDATPLTTSNTVMPLKPVVATSMSTAGTPLRPVPLPMALGGMAALLLLGTAVYREAHKAKVSALPMGTGQSRITNTTFPLADTATTATVDSAYKETEDVPGGFSASTPSLSTDTIATVLFAHKTLTGEADDSRRHVKWPFCLRPTEFDTATGRMVGSLEWTTLGSIHLVEGEWTNHVLTFKETAFIRKGKAVLGPEYRLSENGEHKLTGTWQHIGRGTGGTFWCGEAASNISSDRSSGNNVAKPSERALTEADLVGKSRWELILMRNAPYARHGYRFHEAKLFNYFSQQSWYHPDTGEEEKVYRLLTGMERRNVEVLKAYQSLHKL